MSEGRSGVRPFSAKRPERVRALILYGSYLCMAGGSWGDVDRDPAELRSGVTSVDPELDEKYWPSTEQVARIQQLFRLRCRCGADSSTHFEPGGRVI
jgi:hypothetical protein